MTKRRPIVLAAIASLLAAAIPAQGATVAGAGAGVSCGRWTAMRHQSAYASTGLEIWVLGFLSGVAIFGADGQDPLATTDAEGVFGSMDDYCRTRPTMPLTDALTAYVITEQYLKRSQGANRP